ncbi:S8 family serine peptidase [Kitasatospora sp. NPDC002543]
MTGVVATQAAADDSIRQQQWHLEAMRAPEMWKVAKGQGVTVAVIDSGFKLDHPDLEGQFLPGKDFSGSPGGFGSFADGHGTGIASLIAGTGKGNSGTGAQGVSPGVKILPLKINTGKVGSLVSTDFLDQIGQALVSASAALVWSLHPDWTGNQVLRVLTNTAGKANDASGRNDLIGYGAVRPRVALTDPGDPGPANVSPLSADAAPVPSAPASAVPVPVESPTDVPSARPVAGKSEAGSGGALPVVGGVVAGLVLVAGVVFAVVRRRRKPEGVQVPPPEDNPYAR